ncbi:MAG: hypothetical protein GX128_10715 [Bacteroidales bacterium]|nr:hypothetical protein [Bacteroidales bacterium]
MKNISNKYHVDKLCIIVTLVMWMPLLTLGQVYYDTIAWIWVNDNTFHAADGNLFTNKNEFNIFLETNHVVYYEQALPFAKNPELLKIHEIRLNSQGSIDYLYYSLTSNYPEVFDNLSRFSLPDTTLYVYNPADHMWNLTLNDPNQWL